MRHMTSLINIFRILGNLTKALQTIYFKTTKHLNSFVSHCSLFCQIYLFILSHSSPLVQSPVTSLFLKLYPRNGLLSAGLPVHRQSDKIDNSPRYLVILPQPYCRPYSDLFLLIPKSVYPLFLSNPKSPASPNSLSCPVQND